jgi:hypothetical protein
MAVVALLRTLALSSRPVTEAWLFVGLSLLATSCETFLLVAVAMDWQATASTMASKQLWERIFPLMARGLVLASFALSLGTAGVFSSGETSFAATMSHVFAGVTVLTCLIFMNATRKLVGILKQVWHFVFQTFTFHLAGNVNHVNTPLFAC